MSLVVRFELSAYGRPYHAARTQLEPDALNSVMHGHADFHELMAVVGGRGQHLLGTRSVPLEYGEVVLVRPRDQHAMTGLPPDGLEFINVAFPTAVWHGFLDPARSDPGWDAGREPPVLRPEADAMVAVFEKVLRRSGTDRACST